MTSKIDEDEYDENSLFNHLLAEKPETSDKSPADRLERIFRTAKAPNEIIKVADFLPCY